MINIKSYATDKDSQGSTNISSNSGFTKVVNSTVQGVNIWGQYHDHTNDVSGDMSNVGNINMFGDVNGANEINADKANITTKITTGDIEADYLEVDEIDAVEVFSEYGEINDISAVTISADNSITTDQLNTNDIHNENSITTKDLTVTGSAHFFELIIDKIKAAGGSVLLTPADGFKTDIVEESGTFEYDLIKYANNDQIFIKDQPFYFSWGNAPKGNNILAELKTSAHNLKYFYSAGQNQRSALLYADGNLRTGTYGNSNDSFVSPYIYVGDISTIRFESDGSPQASGTNAKLCAYDEDLQYIQSNSIGNQQTFTWTKGSTTKWIRFTGRNTFTSGKIYLDNQREGDVTIKFMWCDYKKNGTASSTTYIPKVVGNNIKSFKLYRDNTNTVYKQSDELILDAVPVIDEDGKGKMYDTISETFCNVSSTANDYTGNEKVESGYTDLTGYNLYFKSNDGERAIKNMWKVNDQAICQSFNEAEVGDTSQVSNKYYWSLVTSVGTKEINNVEYHYIRISNSTCDGTVNPEAGDEIAMLGYRGTDDEARQSAIYIAAYNSLDTLLVAPLIAQYKGINDFDLGSHRKNVISNGYTAFHGEFYTTSGDDVEDLINDVGQGAISYVHQAFANSADGSVDFSKTYFSGALYTGFCSNHTESDSSLVYSNYTWCRLKGDTGANGTNGTNGTNGRDGTDGIDGEDAMLYYLCPLSEQAPVDTQGRLGLSLSYNIILIEGETYSIISPDVRDMRFVFDAYYTSQLRPTRYDAQDSMTNWTITRESMTYSNSRFQSDWKTSVLGNQLERVEVLLVDADDNIYDRRVVYPVMLPMATFTITDSIKSDVQGHTTSINELVNNQSTIEQTMNSISLTVNQTKRGLAELQYDNKNLYGVSSFAGSELEPGNNWEFVCDVNYDFDLWDNYRCIFDKGCCESRWIMRAAGESFVYAPYLNMSSSYTYTLNMDFLFYDSDNAIKLVKYASKSDAEKLISTQEWYINTNGELVTTRPSHHDYNANEDVIQFSVPANGYYRLAFMNIVSSYDEDDDNYVDLNYVRLYKGEYDADEFENWNTQLSESYSRIYQNAGEIELRVNDVNLRIDNEGIELNGDTTVNGSLTLNDSTQGFVIYNENGSTQITPQSIGTYDQFKQRNKITSNKYLTNTQQLVHETLSGYSYNYYYSFFVNIGNVKANTTIEFANFVLSAYYNNNSISAASTNIQRRTWVDGSVVGNIDNNYTSSKTISSAGNVTFEFIVNLTFNKSLFNISYPTVRVDLSVDTIIPAIALLMIGYDGLGVNYGTTKTVYVGEQQTVFKYGNAIHKIDEDGAKDSVYNIYVNDGTVSSTIYSTPMSGAMNVKTLTFSSTSSYTVDLNDSLIVIDNASNGNKYIYLPLPNTCAGKTYHVKNLATNESIYVQPNTTYDLMVDSNDRSNQAKRKIQLYNRAHKFISNGTYWIVYD